MKESSLSHCKVITQNTKRIDNEGFCAILVGFRLIIHYTRTKDDHDDVTAKWQP
jgi:hypothetical protein